MSLPSPFASADVQIGKAQPEVVSNVTNRKRARCPSADLDSGPISKIPLHTNRHLDAAAAHDPSQITLHRPTPHRPTASTPCCFGVPAASKPLQFGQLRASSFVTARPTVPAVVPSSLATAAALANAPKSSGSNPSDDDQGSPTQPVCSQECKVCQGEQQPATWTHCCLYEQSAFQYMAMSAVLSSASEGLGVLSALLLRSLAVCCLCISVGF